MAAPRVSRAGAVEHVLTAAGRALAAGGAKTVAWEHALQPPSPPARGARARPPDAGLTPLDLRRQRGRIDALALHARHHDPRVAVDGGAEPPVAALLAALEEVRVQALGARVLPGVANNLRELLGHECEQRNYHTLQHRRDAPLLDALAFHVRAIVAPGTVPAGAQRLVSAWAGLLDPLSAELRAMLLATVDDQARFRAACMALVERIGGIDATLEVPSARRPVHSPLLRAEDLVPSEAQRETLTATVPFAANQGLAAVSVERRTPGWRVRARLERGGVSDGRARALDAVDEGREAYRVFDPAWDVVREAAQLRSADELGRLRARLDELVARHPQLVARLANRLRRSLLAHQRQDWTRDLDEGGLDSSRLARAVVDPNCPLSYRQQREVPTRDTVVTLLIDNSGSMAGRPIETAAVCADILARTLERCGVRSEILGFTTGAWKGGQARERWKALGRPPRPGRLNELLHIVYKPADASWRRAREGLALMLDASVLKENVDGEALLWAHQRLLARPERRRILIVISDGEPADETTTDANGSSYLERHLRRVIGTIESRSPVQLVAIGVAHDVARHYRRSLTIDEPGQLGDALAGQLARVLGEDVDGGWRVAAAARRLNGYWNE